MTAFHDAMGLALAEAHRALEYGDIPIGAVLLDPKGEAVAADHNRREELHDPTAHAELLVLSRAARARGDWRLPGHTLVVTLEPCPMCAMAAVWGRLERIVYGAANHRSGAAWTLYNIPQDRRLNHRCELVAGVREEECAALLPLIFKGKR